MAQQDVFSFTKSINTAEKKGILPLKVTDHEIYKLLWQLE